MESELLKEPWVFPHGKLTSLNKQENNIAFSIWEENFQDLSGWCMGTFQNPCGFPVGESNTPKLSGAKYEGNDVSNSKKELIIDSVGGREKDRWSMKLNSIEAIEVPGDDQLLLLPSLQTEANKEFSTSEKSAIIDVWMNPPEKMIPITASTTLKNESNVIEDNSQSLIPEYNLTNLPLDNTCPTPFEAEKIPIQSWDILQSVETTGSDNFDLLSYVCDDDIHSPQSNVSTNSSVTLQSVSLATSPPIAIQDDSINRTADLEKIKQRKKAARSGKRNISSSSEDSIVLSRRSEKMRISNTAKGNDYYEKRQYTRGKKRCAEKEMDYKESREKNNEASRKSRMNKKAKESEMALRAIELDRDNRILKMKVEELEKLVTSMRSALLRSAMKKEF